MQTLTPEIIQAAIIGFEKQKQQIDSQISELQELLHGAKPEPASSSSNGAKTKRKFSTAALERMREAQQRRWAKVRGEKGKAKSRLSAEGRKAIVEALKRRWAAKKAQTA